MIGKVAVYVSGEDRDYLSYVKDVSVHLGITPHFLYIEEEYLLGDLFGFFTTPSEEKQAAVKKHIQDFFDNFIFYALPGREENTVAQLQENYDLIFVKYKKHLFGKSTPEWLLSEMDNIRLWVYKEGSGSDIRRVCLPVDFSERSLRQVEFVEHLKSFLNFEYCLVYALNVGRLRGKLSEKDYSMSLSDKHEEVRHMYMDLFGEKQMELILLEGDPYRDMVRHINSAQYDLVVVGRRGKGMRERIGSVSLHLVRSLKCPVVVL